MELQIFLEKEVEKRNLRATSIYTIKEGHNFSMKVN
jgi:hypothetical protein